MRHHHRFAVGTFSRKAGITVEGRSNQKLAVVVALTRTRLS